MKDLIGKKYGKLTVCSHVGETRYKRGGVTQLWECKCDCGEIVVVREGNLIRSLSGNPKCKKCAYKEAHRSKQEYKITSAVWFAIKQRSEYRHIELDVNPEWLYELFVKQDGKCAISGVPLQFAPTAKRKIETTASLDRISSDKGYIKDNVQWVHKTVNIMKNAMSTEELIKWCSIIIQHQNL